MAERLASVLQLLAVEFGNAELGAQPWLVPDRAITGARWRFELAVEQRRVVWWRSSASKHTSVTLEVDLGRRREVAPPLERRAVTYYPLRSVADPRVPGPAPGALDLVGLFGDRGPTGPVLRGVVVVDPLPASRPQGPGDEALVALAAVEPDGRTTRTTRTRADLRATVGASTGSFTRRTYRRWSPPEDAFTLTRGPAAQRAQWIVSLEADLGSSVTTWFRPWRLAARTWKKTPFPIALVNRDLYFPPWGAPEVVVQFRDTDALRPGVAVDRQGRLLDGDGKLAGALLRAADLLARWWRDEVTATPVGGRYAAERASGELGWIVDDLADGQEALEQALPAGWGVARFEAAVRSDPAPGRPGALQARFTGQTAADQVGLLASVELPAPPFVRALPDGRGLEYRRGAEDDEDAWIRVDVGHRPAEDVARDFFRDVKAWARVERPTG